MRSSVGYQLSRGMHNGDVSDLRDRVIQRHLIIVGNPQFTGLFPDQLSHARVYREASDVQAFGVGSFGEWSGQ